MITRDKYFLVPIIFSIVSTLLITTLLGIFFISLPANLPLFYSKSWGEEQLATKQQLLILPSIIILVTLINIVVAWQLHINQIILRRIILACIIAIDLIIVITAVKILTIFI